MNHEISHNITPTTGLKLKIFLMRNLLNQSAHQGTTYSQYYLLAPR